MLSGIVIAVLSINPVFAEDNGYHELDDLFRCGDWLYRDRGDHISVCGYLGNEEHITIPSVIDGKEVLEVSYFLDLNKHKQSYFYAGFFMEEKIKTYRRASGSDSEETGIKTAEDDYMIREKPSTKRITLPDTVKTIGKSAFIQCDRLEVAELPQGLEVIEDEAFKSCSNLFAVNFPEGLKIIGEDSFYSTNITSIQLPQSLVYIGSGAFISSDFSVLEIPDSVQYIGKTAFAHCRDLETAKLSENIKEIPSQLFNRCASLKVVELPEGVRSVDGTAFEGCTSLEEIYIPKSVEKIYPALLYLPSLKNVYFAADKETAERIVGGNTINSIINDSENKSDYSGVSLHFGEKEEDIKGEDKKEEIPVKSSDENDKDIIKNIFMVTAILFSAAFLAVLILYVRIKIKTTPEAITKQGNALSNFKPADTAICKRCGAENGKNADYCYNCGRRIKSR